MISELRGNKYPLNYLNMMAPESLVSMPSRDTPIKKDDYFLNGLKARSTQRVEIPVILSRKVTDPATHKVVFDTFNGPLSTTIEFKKYETSNDITYNTLTFLPMASPKEDTK